MKTKNYCIITTSIDDENIADKISTSLLKDHLVACVQSHTVQSKYNWDGNLESKKEILLQMKTKTSMFEEVKVQIKSLHTYDLPEIVMTPIIDANEAYLEWIENEVQESKILNSKRVLFVCIGNICRSPLGEGIAKDIIDYNISSVRREYDNYRASYKNIKRMITDAIELIRNTAFSVDVTDISLEEEKSCVIYLTITNKTDLPLYNVSVVLQKWVPPKNIEFKNLHKRIDMIESKKAAIIPFEMTIFKEHISEVIMKRLLIFGFDDNGDQYSTIKENIKIKIPIREKNNINKAS